MSKADNVTVDKKNEFSYTKFREIDGQHPFQKAAPEAVIEYNVRKRHGGKVLFFNFDLAIEMGLLPKNHPIKISARLERQILDTFSLVIINEYDIDQRKKFPKKDIKKNKYMATRYLQLQHQSKLGTTSGDGRSIWNGNITNRGITWDISSCGTGATALSPATHIKGKFFETGDPSISYGCGYFEKDEGMEALFFSEVLSQNNFKTERILAIIEFSGGIAISVRAHQNLLRPSHFFNHLKQGNLEILKQITNYFIARQEKNRFWQDVPHETNQRYEYFSGQILDDFSKTVARFEDEYIFCWMDWDGDNILMDGGIIDYGSIRQFGLFHHQYRFDDDDRYSTNLLEQKYKCRYIIQCFIQMIDFLKSGKKKNLATFRNHKHLKMFDEKFNYYKNKNLLYKIGLNEKQQEYILKYRAKDIANFRKSFAYFERVKAKRGKYNVSDGITWDAIFCMRDILRELPQMLLARGESIKKHEFIEILKSTYAKKKDLNISSYRSKKIDSFQLEYMKIVNNLSKYLKCSDQDILLEIAMRSSVINKYDRITGDSISTISNKVMNFKPKLTPLELYDLVKQFVGFQNSDSKKIRSIHLKSDRQKKYISAMLKIVREYSEGL